MTWLDAYIEAQERADHLTLEDQEAMGMHHGRLHPWFDQLPASPVPSALPGENAQPGEPRPSPGLGAPSACAPPPASSAVAATTAERVHAACREAAANFGTLDLDLVNEEDPGAARTARGQTDPKEARK